MKKQLGPSDVIFPLPAALIVSGIDEDANIITIARIGIPTPIPPTIGISVKNSRYSLGLIRKTNEFSVNIPPASLFKAVDYCGMATGRKRNKVVETHIDKDKADASKHMGVDISKIDPLVYCARVREYWTMGNMLGFGLQAGKEIKE